jgi:hypothetical protein
LRLLQHRVQPERLVAQVLLASQSCVNWEEIVAPGDLNTVSRVEDDSHVGPLDRYKDATGRFGPELPVSVAGDLVRLVTTSRRAARRAIAVVRLSSRRNSSKPQPWYQAVGRGMSGWFFVAGLTWPFTPPLFLFNLGLATMDNWEFRHSVEGHSVGVSAASMITLRSREQMVVLVTI